MPVLPQFQGADTLNAFNRGAQTVSGFMDRRNQRTLDQQNIEANQQKLELNSLLRPVVEAKATADLMTNLSAIKQQEYNLKQQENIAQSRIEAGQQFHELSNLDPIYSQTADGRRTIMGQKRQKLKEYIQAFGQYSEDPVIGPQIKMALEELKNIQGLEQLDIQDQMTAARAAMAQTALFAQQRALEEERTRRSIEVQNLRNEGAASKPGAPSTQEKWRLERDRALQDARDLMATDPQAAQQRLSDAQDYQRFLDNYQPLGQEPQTENVKIGPKEYTRDRVGGSVRYFDSTTGEPVSFGSSSAFDELLANAIAGKNAKTASPKSVDQPFDTMDEFQAYADENGLSGEYTVTIGGQQYRLNISPQ